MIKGIPCAFGWDAKCCDETLVSHELGKGPGNILRLCLLMFDGHTLPVSPVNMQTCLLTHTNDWTDLQLFSLSSISFWEFSQSTVPLFAALCELHSNLKRYQLNAAKRFIHFSAAESTWATAAFRAPERDNEGERKTEKTEKEKISKIKGAVCWDTVLTGKMIVQMFKMQQGYSGQLG